MLSLRRFLCAYECVSGGSMVVWLYIFAEVFIFRKHRCGCGRQYWVCACSRQYWMSMNLYVALALALTVFCSFCFSSSLLSNDSGNMTRGWLCGDMFVQQILAWRVATMQKSLHRYRDRGITLERGLCSRHEGSLVWWKWSKSYMIWLHSYQILTQHLQGFWTKIWEYLLDEWSLLPWRIYVIAKESHWRDTKPMRSVDHTWQEGEKKRTDKNDLMSETK